MAPLIIAELNIILFLTSLIAGIICVCQVDLIGAFGKPLLPITSTVFSATFTIANIPVWLRVRARSGVFLIIVMF